MSETILIIGFEPFGGIAGNPTMDIVAALHGARIDSRQVVGRILPVAYDGHRLRLKTLIDEVEPAVIVGFGLDIKANGIQIETKAINEADFEIPDNAGTLLKNVRLDPGGPNHRTATLPLVDIGSALSAIQIEVTQSADAGRYLCNATLYHLLELAAMKPQQPICGFIHVPYSVEQLALMRRPAAAIKTRAMPLEMMIEAARIILRQSSLVARQGMAVGQPLTKQDWSQPAPLHS